MILEPVMMAGQELAGGAQKVWPTKLSPAFVVIDSVMR
jgi:hypothetical protein